MKNKNFLSIEIRRIRIATSIYNCKNGVVNYYVSLFSGK